MDQTNTTLEAELDDMLRRALAIVVNEDFDQHESLLEDAAALFDYQLLSKVRALQDILVHIEATDRALRDVWYSVDWITRELGEGDTRDHIPRDVAERTVRGQEIRTALL